MNKIPATCFAQSLTLDCVLTESLCQILFCRDSLILAVFLDDSFHTMKHKT